MKRKTQSFRKELKMPRLFRDDLNAIEKVIKEELKPESYKLETKEYEYEAVESIPKDTGTTTEFNIETRSPYISIDFHRSRADIYTSDDNLITTGAVAKILNILAKKERKILFWFQQVAIWIAPILFGTFIARAISRSAERWIFLAISLLAGIWWIFSFYNSMYKFSVINFILPNENPGFIKRNKDQIILLIIGTIFGCLVTKLFNL